MAVAGLRAISSLLYLLPETFEPQDAELLVCLSTFTDLQDPWTRTESHERARGLLGHYEALQASEVASTIPGILQKVVRPAFSKQKQAAITAGGRKAMTPADSNVGISFRPEAEEKPWKFQTPWVTTVFLWCITKISVRVSSVVRHVHVADQIYT